MLSPFIVPLSLSVLVGANVQMDVWGMMKGLAEMVVIPSIAGDDGQPVFPPVDSGDKPVAVSFSKICLMIVIAINSSEIAPYVTHVDIKFAGIAGTVFLLP